MAEDLYVARARGGFRPASNIGFERYAKGGAATNRRALLRGRVSLTNRVPQRAARAEAHIPARRRARSEATCLTSARARARYLLLPKPTCCPARRRRARGVALPRAARR